ncbi:MAG: hypothetical protein AAF483_12670, partial [Planctomycetota bacterium]
KQPLWSGWLELQKLDVTKPESTQPVWGKWLSAESIAEMQDSAPSLTRGIQLANVHAVNLQSIQIPELTKSLNNSDDNSTSPNVQELFLQVAPLKGEPLSDYVRNSQVSAEESQQLISQVAGALSALHEAQVVHGRVLPDRIYFDGSNATLVLDPISVVTATSNEHATGLFGSHLHNLSTAHFLAPEFSAPGQTPTTASDVFALGCTWYWLLTGSPLTSGKNTSAILAKQGANCSEKVSALGLAEPVARVLGHMLSGDIKGRFSCASQAAIALETALKVQAKGKVRVSVKAQTSPSKTKALQSESPPTSGLETSATSNPSDANAAVGDEKSKQPGRTATPVKVAGAVAVRAVSKSRTPEQVDETSTPSKPGEAKSPSNGAQGTNATVGHNKKTDLPSKEPPSKKRSNKETSTREGSSKEAPPRKDKPDTGVRPAAPSSKPSSPDNKEPETSEAKPTGEKALEFKEDRAASNEKYDGGREKTGISENKQDNSSEESSSAASDYAKFAPTVEESTEDKRSATDNVPNSETSPKKKRRRKKKPGQDVASEGRPRKKRRSDDESGRSRVRKKKKRSNNKWLIPTFGGAGFLLLLLALMYVSGVLDPKEVEEAERPRYVDPENSNTGPAELVEKDPLLKYYNIKESDTLLWAPPVVPARYELDMLPRGPGGLICIRPEVLLNDDDRKMIVSSFSPELGDSIKQVLDAVSLQASDVAHVLIGLYAPKQDGGFPELVYRVQLSSPQPITYLKNVWNNPQSQEFSGKTLLTSGTRAYFVQQQPIEETTEVQAFCVGPTDLMKDSAEIGGGEPPLLAPLEQLCKNSNQNYDFSMVLMPPFLFGDGRGLLSKVPARSQRILRSVIGNDSQGVAVKVHFDEAWYTEVRIAGTSPQEAGRVMSSFKTALDAMPGSVEDWFVSETPHPYWGRIAIRFPQMLRTAIDYTRVGLEDGTAVANVYLPNSAAPSLLTASWVSQQNAATISGGLAVSNTGVSTEPLTLEEYLARPIVFSVEQEQLEVILGMIGEEANDGLPEGSPNIRFAVDGDAFGAGGITRVQRIAKLDHPNKPVREALTSLAQMGNPSPGADVKSDDQKLIWIVRDDPQAPGRKLIQLTTREAASKAKLDIPQEFLP